MAKLKLYNPLPVLSDEIAKLLLIDKIYTIEQIVPINIKQISISKDDLNRFITRIDFESTFYIDDGSPDFENIQKRMALIELSQRHIGI